MNVNNDLWTILIKTFGLYSEVNLNNDLGRIPELNIVQTLTLAFINNDLRPLLLGLGHYSKSARF